MQLSLKFAKKHLTKYGILPDIVQEVLLACSSLGT
jgi:hypothetical protein